MAEIPQEIKDKIEAAFPPDTESSTNRQIGACFGYSLASAEIEELKADNLRLQNALADAKTENEMLRADYLQVVSTGDMFKTSDWVSGTWKNHLMNYRKVTEAEYLTYINSKQEIK